jgi:macrolide transport system ATP-binding/permease protein
MFFQDLKYGLRMLVKSPGFSLVAVLSLALGIGANTAIFSLVNALLLRPLPVRDAQALVQVSTTDQRNPGNLPLSHLNFKDLRSQNSSFSDMAAISFNQVNYSHGQESEQIPVQIVTANFFSLLGAEPALGRGFRAEEETQAIPVTVVSHGFWERSLGSNPNVVGTTIVLNRTPYTVVGVAPKNFTGVFLGGGPSAWLPMTRNAVVLPEWYETRRGLFLFSVARLKPGVTVEQARANLRSIFANLEQAFPVDNKGRSATAVPLLEARLNPNGQGANVLVQQSTVLMIVVGIVLLIACANIANLLLSRASKRRREVAIRLALGAKRMRLVRQLLTESLLLSILGGIAGMGLASWTLSAIVAARLPLPFPVDREALSLDPTVLAFTAGLALLTGILFGLAPALQASKPDVVPVLKNELIPTATGQRGWRSYFALRQVLVVAQVALSLVALIAAGLFLRELRNSRGIDTGFETKGVLVMNFKLLREGYTPDRGQLFYEQIVEKAAALPGVQGAAIAQVAPLAGGFARSVFPEGADTTTTGRILVQVNTVGTGYFQTIGIPIVRGRDFTRADTAQSPKVVVVNETMAKQFWKGEEPLGKRFKFFGDQDFTTVIGVAKDSKYNGVADDPQNFIYQPMAQNYTPQATLHVRSAGDAASLANAARGAVRDIDPSLSVFNVRTLEEQVSASLQPLMMNVLMLAVFGGLALLLASIGLYGVASYAVTQRTREIGVRMALGAQPSSVLGLVLGHGMVLVGIGLAIGLAAAYAAAGFMRSLVLVVNPHDPATFAITAGLLGAVALVASYIPARRATRIDPLIALRTD